MAYCNDLKPGQLVKVTNIFVENETQEDFYLILKKTNINERDPTYYLVHELKTMKEVHSSFQHDSITTVEVVSGHY